MHLTKAKLIIVSVFIILTGCESPPKYYSGDDFYSQVLDEIVSRDHIYSCVRSKEEQMNRWFADLDKLRQGIIDTATFDRREGARKDSIKCLPNKCLFEISEEFGLSSIVPGVDSLSKVSMRYCFKTLLDGFTTNLDTEGFIDSLTTPADINLNTLSVSYLEFGLFKRTEKHYMRTMKGNGIFTISKPIFNSKKDRAVIYYEFVCGVKCHSGNLLLMAREKNRWIMKDGRNIWIE